MLSFTVLLAFLAVIASVTVAMTKEELKNLNAGDPRNYRKVDT